MAMDKFPVVGHQMTHSIDSFITDSANSAAALNTGHKSTVNCLNVYAVRTKAICNLILRDYYTDRNPRTAARIHSMTPRLRVLLKSSIVLQEVT
jgi:hypothetical protein